jgi:hypothetical protein
MQGTEIEVPDQSDIIPQRIIKEKKPDVQTIIDDLAPCSSKYVPIRVPYIKPMLSDELRSKQHTFLSIFQLPISSTLLQIMANNTNINADLKRDEVTHQQRSWQKITEAEIEAFMSILLYMGYTMLPSTRDY